MTSYPAALAKHCLQAVGHYRRKLESDRFPGAAVLCYHGVRSSSSEGPLFRELHVTRDELEAHCEFLTRACHPISLDTWLAAAAGEQALPPRAVLVTFDDGYRSVRTLAQPVLEGYRIPYVVFVTSGPVRDRRMFWHDAVGLERGIETVEAWKRLPYADWRSRCTALERACDRNGHYAPLTVDDVRSLAESSLAEIGGHTASHAILARATPDEQRNEIEMNREELERWTDKPVRAFAYPNGRPGEDFTDESAQLVRAAGYSAAFTTENGFASSTGDLLHARRFLMLSGVSQAELGHRLAYSWRGARV